MDVRLATSLLAAALVSGCQGGSRGRREAPDMTASTRPLAPVAPSVSPAPPAPAAPASAPDAEMPGPLRMRREEAVRLNATCEACHTAEASGWQRSHHAQSGVNPAYRRSLANEPTPFCRGCHVPEGNPRGPSPAAIEALGVGCVTCHVTTPGEVLAAVGPGAAGAPHAVRRSESFTASGACQNCHEFRFPGSVGDADGRFMQTTVREHARSSSASTPCAGCHMPAGEDGHRSHAFAQMRDPAWLRSQLAASAERDEDDVLITLRQTGPGHAFPSGDLFRRLEVGVEARDASGRVVERQRRHLARHLEVLPGAGPAGRQLTLDNRVLDRPSVVEFSLPPATHGLTLSWWVTYERVASVGAGHEPGRATVESRVPLASGVLSPPP